MEQFDSSVEESSKVSEQQQRNDEQQLVDIEVTIFFLQYLSSKIAPNIQKSLPCC